MCRWLGLHKWEELTPEHGFDLRVGGLDDDFDPAQFLFVTRCTRCNKIEALVMDGYWTGQEHTVIRKAEESETRKFLVHYEAQRRKTATTGKLPMQKAFTIIELLCVIAIIVIIAAIAIPNLLESRKQQARQQGTNVPAERPNGTQ
jgi:prepilin-type N-terminal cleavage/methylation domain-containing protein